MIDQSDMKIIARGLAPVLADHVQAALAPLADRIAELERRLAEAEAKPKKERK